MIATKVIAMKIIAKLLLNLWKNDMQDFFPVSKNESCDWILCTFNNFYLLHKYEF